MWKTPIGRLRALGMLEGTSFLILLFVAMPLKYLAGKPEAVMVVGWVHGVLFVAFCVALLLVIERLGWSYRKAAVPFLAALLPFGPFVIDRKLRLEEETGGDGDGD